MAYVLKGPYLRSLISHRFPRNNCEMLSFLSANCVDLTLLLIVLPLSGVFLSIYLALVYLKQFKSNQPHNYFLILTMRYATFVPSLPTTEHEALHV